MRTVLIMRFALAAAFAVACAAGSRTRPASSARFNTDMQATAEQVAAMPDTIRCDGAVVVRARDTQRGLEAQRRWLDRFYPGHGGYRQAVAQRARQKYEVLVFSRSNGRTASVCFDVSSFSGTL